LASTWGQLGLTGEFADKSIQTYGHVSPGLKIYLERKLNHWSQKWNENYNGVRRDSAADEARCRLRTWQAGACSKSCRRTSSAWVGRLDARLRRIHAVASQLHQRTIEEA
jgi:hypothetical protein